MIYKRKWENNIKIDLEQVHGLGMEWIWQGKK
jgi:hypothetical protein